MSKYTLAQAEYYKKRIRYTIHYGVHDHEEGVRLQEYLTDTHQTANEYIKKLIKIDLDKKGV